MSDGSTRDLTASVNWRSSDTAVLSISRGGTATAAKAGQAVIVAEAIPKRASLAILVLPPGTFRLSGFVREAGLPVLNARIDLLNGSIPVMTTYSLSDGAYNLFGVVGDIEVRATKPGYADQVNRLRVSSNITSDFQLTQTGRTDLAGRYQLDVTAGSQCRTLPDAAKARTYAAEISQDGPRLTVVLSGLVSGTFTGRTEPGAVTFDIRGTDPYYYYYYYVYPPLDVLEQFTSTSLFTFAGRVNATASGGQISGTLKGVLATLQSPISGYPRTIASCGGQHPFVLTRQ
jgi:hypothetical protein